MIRHDWMSPGGIDPLWLIIDRKNQHYVRVIHTRTEPGKTVITYQGQHHKETVVLPYRIRGLDIQSAARLVSRHWNAWSDVHPSEWVDVASLATDGKTFVFTSPCKG